jgi:hypothetical protein
MRLDTFVSLFLIVADFFPTFSQQHPFDQAVRAPRNSSPPLPSFSLRSRRQRQAASVGGLMSAAANGTSRSATPS